MCTLLSWIIFSLLIIWFLVHFLALNKSQKEANTLVQKCSNEKGIGIHIQGKTSRSSKLEMDLMDQWRSLFLHMEDIFQQESSQLVSFILSILGQCLSIIKFRVQGQFLCCIILIWELHIFLMAEETKAKEGRTNILIWKQLQNNKTLNSLYCLFCKSSLYL